MDWIIGLCTAAIILGGGYWIGIAMFHDAFGRFPWGREIAEKTDYRAIADRQATLSECKIHWQLYHDAEAEWFETAAMRLMELWPGISYDRAMRELRDYMAEIAKYGDPSFSWTRASAREVAEEYSREYGEHHGCNA